MPELPQTPPARRNWREAISYGFERLAPIALMGGLILTAVMLLSLWLPLVLSALLVLAAAAGAIGSVFLLIRRLEKKDAVHTTDSPQKAREVAAQEDHQAQNQLSMQLDIKDGWLRYFLIHTVYSVGHYLVRHYWNKGRLAGIPSIHFARFFIDKKNRRMVFFSNYDGSWESYLSDFLTTGAIAVVPIWTHCKDCPRTRFMFFLCYVKKIC